MTMTGRIYVKICGLTHEEHVLAAADAGADLAGFVLWPGSVRAITRARAEEFAALAQSRGLAAVALLVDPAEDDLARLDAFDLVQCHGAESCAVLAASQLPTIKGFAFDPDAFQAWSDCEHADWLLADGPRGGGGETFDHAALAACMPITKKPVLLAGGLTPTNVAAAIATVRPFGVDVSSGVERTRGAKDPELIAAFCRAVRDAENS